MNLAFPLALLVAAAPSPPEILARARAAQGGAAWDRRFVARIDSEHGQLALIDRAAFRYRGTGAVLPFVFESHIPQVEGSIDGIPGKFDLDTGSRASLDLFSPFVKEHRLVERYGAKMERIGGWGVGGPSRQRPVRAKALVLGPVEIPAPVVGLSTSTRGAFARTGIAGNVGSGVLSRFTVTFDCARQEVILEKNARFDRHDPVDRSGLWLHAAKGGFEVIEVVPGTPAAQAGLQAGDRIVSWTGSRRRRSRSTRSGPGSRRRRRGRR